MLERNDKEKNQNVQKIFATIENEISNDIDFAKEMLDQIDRQTYSIEYNYLLGMIKEQERLAEYDSKKREKYEEYLNLGIGALDNCDYAAAYNYFAAGYDATKNNIFNYYMGKALFKEGNKRAAYPYFDGYTRLGGSKLPKALLYLMSSYIHIGKEKKVRKYYNELVRINKSFNHSFKIVSPFNKHGELKKKRFLPYVTEDDFTNKGVELSLDNYYEYSIDNQLILIENLFREGNYRVADKLLRELNPVEKKQKIKVQELERNKTLYKNKRSN